MSRILRRPMFRGGGPINSYGTGIAAPLVPGYQGGGQIGGGIIYGLPHRDGRYGFEAPKLFNAAELTMPNNFISPGMEYLEKLKNIKQGKVPMIPINTEKDEVPAGVDTQSTEIEDIDTEKVDDRGIGQRIYDFFNPSPETIIEKYNKNLEDMTTFDDKMKNWFGIDTLKVQEEKKEREKNIDTSGNELPPSLRNLNKEIPDLNTNLGEGAEEPVVDAKTMMEENAELFKEMLGIKKARGQDISDMLLRFSGSKGDTLGEKFQNYTALESAAGPGRAEQIGKTAAGLSIQDYVAGKRAKEAVDLMKSKVDYEYGKKGEIVNVQKTDNATEALLKIGKKGDVKPNSDAAIKYLVGIADDRSDVFSVNQKGLMKKIGENPAKAMKQLKNGVNIVRDGGQIAIVITDGNNITEIFDSVSEYWNANK